jgi:hypothetical protein
MQASLVRITGIAAVLAAFGILGSYWLTEERKRAYPALKWWAYVGNNFPLMLTFVGMYVFLGEAGRPWGLLGFIAAAVGSILMTYPDPIGTRDGYGIGSGLLGLAIGLIAIGGVRSGVLPVWVSALWGGAVLLGIPGMLISSARMASYVLGGISFSLGLIAAGYFMMAG